MSVSMNGNPSYTFDEMETGCYFLCPSYSDGLFTKTITTKGYAGELYNAVSAYTGFSVYFDSKTAVIPVAMNVEIEMEFRKKAE